MRYPEEEESVGRIRAFLEGQDNNPDLPEHKTYGYYKQVVANVADESGADWVILFFVERMKTCHIKAVQRMKYDVAEAYGIYDNNQKAADWADGGSDSNGIARKTVRKRQRSQMLGPPHPMFNFPTPKLMGDPNEATRIGPRRYWELSQVAVAPGEKWDSIWQKDMTWHKMWYDAHESFSEGQTIFILEDGYWSKGPDLWDERDNILPYRLRRPPIRSLPEFEWTKIPQLSSPPDLQHGTGMVSRAVGWELGLAKKAQVVVVTGETSAPADGLNTIYERHLERWARIYNEVKALYKADPSQRGKIIVSCSHIYIDRMDNRAIKLIMVRRLYEIKKLEDLDVVIVATSHNNWRRAGDDLRGIPLRFADPL